MTPSPLSKFEKFKLLSAICFAASFFWFSGKTKEGMG